MIHPSTGTLASTRCPIYGMRSWSTPLTFTWNRPSLPGQSAHCIRPLYKPTRQCKGVHILCLQNQQLVGMGSCIIINLVASILAPGDSSHNQWCHLWQVLILVSITFSHRPKEAMLFAMVKACLDWNNFLFVTNTNCICPGTLGR